MQIEATYFAIRSGTVHRTVEINPSTLVDVDEQGRILGIENINGHAVDLFAVLFDDRLRLNGLG